MSSRDFLLLALRILAFWGLIAAAPALGSVASTTFSILYDSMHKRELFSDEGSMELIVVRLWIQPAVQITAAVLLWRWAPTIARAAYRGATPKQRTVMEVVIDPNDAYRVGLRLLGGWAVFQSVSPLFQAPHSTYWRSYLGTGLFYLVGGLLLMIGPRRALRAITAAAVSQPTAEDNPSAEARQDSLKAEAGGVEAAPPAASLAEPK